MYRQEHCHSAVTESRPGDFAALRYNALRANQAVEDYQPFLREAGGFERDAEGADVQSIK